MAFHLPLCGGNACLHLVQGRLNGERAVHLAFESAGLLHEVVLELLSFVEFNLLLGLLPCFNFRLGLFGYLVDRIKHEVGEFQPVSL